LDFLGLEPLPTRRRRQDDGGFDHTDGIDCEVILDVSSKVAVPVSEIATPDGQILEEQLQESRQQVYES